MTKKNPRKAIFGDFQTPHELALQVCHQASKYEPHPACIVEPTCGKGSFLTASLATFQAQELHGVEMNAGYLLEAKEKLNALHSDPSHVSLTHQDFFAIDWDAFLSKLPQPILIIGNPPWVTNSEMGQLDAQNLPEKSNFQKYSGLDAITGKSNFDISEWISLHLLKALSSKKATLAFLLKTTVARKILEYAWQHDLPIQKPAIFLIDAKTHFHAAVDACLFLCKLGEPQEKKCPLYQDLSSNESIQTIGYHHNRLLANLSHAKHIEELQSDTTEDEWRSGIKHDCAPILEIIRSNDFFYNQLGESVHIEDQFLFPLFKSSDVAHQKQKQDRFLIVPQKTTNEDTRLLLKTAPLLWAYLLKHNEFFDKRKSSIYKGKPHFSIFGVGDYTFSPWKIAISGLYKRLSFSVIAPLEKKPVVFDDTVYFLACASKEEALFKAELLNSDLAHAFFSTFIFWDAKRPITAQILKRLSLRKLAHKQNRLDELESLASLSSPPSQSQILFDF